MKKILFFVFTVIALASSCKSDSSQDVALKVLKWGPDEPVKIGTIPNKQPDGKMGIWIDVSSTAGAENAQVVFNGKPVETAISPKNITAGVDPKEISDAGDKKIEIKLPSTGQVIPVGVLKVIS